MKSVDILNLFLEGELDSKNLRNIEVKENTDLNLILDVIDVPPHHRTVPCGHYIAYHKLCGCSKRYRKILPPDFDVSSDNNAE